VVGRANYVALIFSGYYSIYRILDGDKIHIRRKNRNMEQPIKH